MLCVYDEVIINCQHKTMCLLLQHVYLPPMTGISLSRNYVGKFYVQRLFVFSHGNCTFVIILVSTHCGFNFQLCVFLISHTATLEIFVEFYILHFTLLPSTVKTRVQVNLVSHWKYFLTSYLNTDKLKVLSVNVKCKGKNKVWGYCFKPV